MKTYIVTNKGQYAPVSLGAARKSSWTSTKWVDYHLTRGWRASQLNKYDVHTVDLASGTVSRCSAVAFIASLPRNIEKSRTEIQAMFGLPLDLATLDALYKKGVFIDSLAARVKDYLFTKGITV
jgi:hypothetical protein